MGAPSDKVQSKKKFYRSRITSLIHKCLLSKFFFSVLPVFQVVKFPVSRVLHYIFHIFMHTHYDLSGTISKKLVVFQKKDKK